MPTRRRVVVNHRWLALRSRVPQQAGTQKRENACDPRRASGRKPLLPLISLSSTLLLRQLLFNNSCRCRCPLTIIGCGSCRFTALCVTCESFCLFMPTTNRRCVLRYRCGKQRSKANEGNPDPMPRNARGGNKMPRSSPSLDLFS